MEGLRVLVTGGSGGIGQGICQVAAREGAKVAFTWRGNQTGADETAALIREHGGESLAIQADLRERDAAAQVIATIEAAWGAVDTLVNNAAVSEAVPFILLDDDDFADMMELNLFGAFRMCRAAVRGMIRQKHGRIVNISSITGSRSIAGPVHYAASKGALEGLTGLLGDKALPTIRTLAREDEVAATAVRLASGLKSQPALDLLVHLERRAKSRFVRANATRARADLERRLAKPRR